MNTNLPNCDLQMFKIGMPLNCPLPKIPTVCLLVSDVLIPKTYLCDLVDSLISSGCTYFMTWGAAAEEIHDDLDEMLEGIGGDCLSVVTASHEGEQIEDVAWFLVNAALPGEEQVRCCVGYADEALFADLLEAIRVEASVR